MSIYTPPFKSDLFYSVQNEDYQPELALVRRMNRAGQRILLVASSGENALSLLTQANIAYLHAIDINPAQLNLCELRQVGVEQLTRDEQLQLLGADIVSHPDAGEAHRLALYDRLRPFLTVAAREFWDARRTQEIAFGVHHAGRNDVGMQDIRVQLQQAGFAPFEQPLHDDDLPRWRSVYEGLLKPDYIMNLFGLPSAALAERIAHIAGYLGECHFRALQQPDADHNPFLTTVFKGSYADAAAGETGLPLYLQETGQTALRALGITERLHLRAGNILEWVARLAADSGLFDLISISNIADWMSPSEFSAVVMAARDCLSSGGTLLARAATPNRMIESVMQQHLEVDLAFNNELQQVERGAWFRVISAGFHA